MSMLVYYVENMGLKQILFYREWEDGQSRFEIEYLRIGLSVIRRM
jgi:hypothetical protein